MERLQRALALAAGLREECNKQFIIDELRRNTRMSLSSARIVLLSALVSNECILVKSDRDNIHELMREIEALQKLQADYTPAPISEIGRRQIK
jgi:hypothetical protein